MSGRAELLPELGEALRAMADELAGSRLVVVLVPQRVRTNEGGCVRVAIEKNARWYRDFCAAYASARRRRNAAHDTRIRRRETLATLAAMQRGLFRSSYCGHLLAIARRRAAAPCALEAAVTARRRALDARALFSA